MTDHASNTGRMLLHACCGPCTMEPLRILREQGADPVVFYANSNISPSGEYSRRLSTLRSWAQGQSLEVVEGVYDHAKWEKACKEPFENDETDREGRCRACYRLRFEESARYARENGFATLCTTLSVSPYQYTEIIREELERACEKEGVEAVFEDFRPYYDEATRRSREAGMYRQNYCGCEISAAEAQREREQRKAERKLAKEQWAKDHASDIAEEKERLEARRAEKRAYDEKRRRQKEILKRLRCDSDASAMP